MENVRSMEKRLKKSVKTSGVMLGALIVSVVLHNFASGLIGKEEPVFFIISLVLMFMFPIALFYSIGLLLVTLLDKTSKK